MVFKDKELQLFSRKRTVIASVITSTFIVLIGCSVKYSFSGASIPPEVKTFSIQYIANRAPLATANLNQRLTDKLREKIEGQTNLVFSIGNADVDFEGEIIRYDTEPTTITANERPEQNKLSIGIRIKFTNMKDPKLDYDKTFTRFEEYASSADVDETIEDAILDDIVQDIFNEAFVNW
ncbi:LPS assembly lipoprotein LptE [Bacteroidota bacterium]